MPRSRSVVSPRELLAITCSVYAPRNMNGSVGTRYDTSNRPTPVFCIDTPKFPTRTCTAATFELVSTVPDAISPPVSIVPGAMFIATIAGGASGDAIGDCGNGVATGADAGRGEAEGAELGGAVGAAVADGAAEAESTANGAGDACPLWGAFATARGDGEALGAELEGDWAEQALATSSARDDRTAAIAGNLGIIRARISMPPAPFSALTRSAVTRYVEIACGERSNRTRSQHRRPTLQRGG